MTSPRPTLKLSDVLGAMVSSIASARHVADMEALRIAHRYQQNELLRGLPVPRLRFSRVTVSLPVVITGVITGEPAQSAPVALVVSAASEVLRTELDTLAATDPGPPPDADVLLDRTDDVEHDAGVRLARVAADGDGTVTTFESELPTELDDALLDLRHANGGVPLPDAVLCATAAEVSGTLVRRILRRALMQDHLRSAPAAGGAADAEAARQSAEATLESKLAERIVRRVAEAALRAATASPTTASDVEVVVNTGAVMNTSGGPSALTQIQFTLLEEGLEWIGETRRDGARDWKLTQE